MSANQITYNADTAQIAVDGSAGVDQVSVFTASADTITVRLISGGETADKVFARSSVASVSFLGRDGNDRFQNSTTVPSIVDGGNGDDELIGGWGNDQLSGGHGHDVIRGGEGDDVLDGGNDNDFVDGDNGNDQISGGWGNDELYGSHGDDLLYGGEGDDRLHGGNGNDQLHGNNGVDHLYGGWGVDRLFGSDGDDLLFGGEDNDHLDGGNGNDQLDGQNGNDYLFGAWGNDQLYGSHGDDQLYGGEEDDQLNGGNGNDLLDGQAGNDSLIGGWGADILRGSYGDDTLLGNEDNDQLDGGNGADVLDGNSGNDELSGGWGIDTLLGSDGDDLLYGGEDDDNLDGGNGNDRLYGNNGNDTLTGNWGEDKLFGGDGNDHLGGGENHDILIGGNGDDLLEGHRGNDLLIGHWGRDTLLGGDGDDLLRGGEDDDSLDGGNGNDRLDGNAGNDSLIGGWGNDELYGGHGDDVLSGNEDHDRLDGGNGNDRLDGHNGNDLIIGGWGIDILAGGDGDDVLHGGQGEDDLNGGNGNDWLNGNTENDTLNGSLGNDKLYGSHGNDVLIGGEDNDDVDGGMGDDILFGNTGNDLLIGGLGNDQLSGSYGHDVLVGGEGDDQLDGQEGNDVLIGGMHFDNLQAGTGDDLLIGGSTAYDGDPSALRLLLSEWTSASSYSARIAAIESETFLARLESTDTVFDDGVADTLTGGGEQDWFFRTGSMEFYSPLAGAHHHGDQDHMPGASGPHSHASLAVIGTLPALEGFEFIDSLDHLVDVQSDERIHSKLPHSDNAMLQGEHLALFELVRYDQVSHIAVASGAWSNPSTWQHGMVPSAGARVLIPVGVEVTVDQIVPTRIATARVDGTLSFSTTHNSELRVDTIVVSTAGRFEMGTMENPIPAGVAASLVFTDDGPIDRTADPFWLGRGLISHGSVSIHGAQVTSHLAVLGSVAAGATTLQLTQVPSGWKAGDYIVLAGTTAGAAQNEVRRISQIIGATVLLDRPLAYEHTPPAPGLAVHLAHVSRNVTIQSENSAVDRRGHVMFMHNRNVHIANAGFYRLGRTDKLQAINDPVVDANWNLAPGTGTNPRARYPVHFHRTGTVADGNPAVVEGSVVSDSPGWGFVNHSSYVDMRNNVAYDVDGAAFTTEVGDEVGGFHGNFAIGSVGSGEDFESRLYVQDFGHQGDGFWFQGGGISVTDNIAAGNSGNAFAYYTRGLIEGGVRKEFLAVNLPDPSMAGGAATIDVSHVPIFEFERNTGYASGTGLSVWYQLRNAPHSGQAVLENSTFWNNTTGGDVSYSQRTTLRNMDFSHAFGSWPFFGIKSNVVTANIVFDNVAVAGYTWGIDVPRQGQTTVIGGYFNNKYNIVVTTGISPSRSVLLTGPITFGLLPPEFANIQHFDVHMRSDFTPISNSINHVFNQDVVMLNYGPFVNQRVYYHSQAASSVPFPTAGAGIPTAYVGLTNQQLDSQFGLSIGDAVAPPLVLTLPNISGLVSPIAGA